MTASSAAQVIKSVGPKLVPFFKTLAVYFVVFIPQNQPSLLATILKCLPIVGLMVFIVLQTKSSGSDYEFSKTLILGLFFCLLGDAFLVWPTYFDIGAVCFLIGHVNYIRALGFKPLNLNVGIAAYSVGIAGTLYILPNLKGAELIGIPLYAITLMTVVWRTATNMQYCEVKTWSRVCTLLGAISFAVSDLFVGIVQFSGEFPHAQLIIMTTYYGAQLGIALSVLDAKITLPPLVKKENLPQEIKDNSGSGVVVGSK